LKHSKTSLPIYLLWAFSWLPYLEISIIFLWRDPEFCHNVSRKVLIPSPGLPPKMHYRTAEYIPCIPFGSNHATQCIITNASCLQHSALFCKRAIDDESLLCQACYGCHYFVLGPTSSKEHRYFIIGWNRGHQSGPIWYQSSLLKPTAHKHVLNMSYWITPNWVILNKLCS